MSVEKIIDGFIAEGDDPEYVLSQVKRYVDYWISGKEYPGCNLTKKVRVKIQIEEVAGDERNA